MLQNLINQYGYLAIFVLMLAESACIPIPSEVIMMFGGALAAGAFAAGASASHPVLIGVVAAGVAGNVAGSYLAWAVGKYAGQAAIHRWGRRIGIREHEIDKATAWFERHGPVAVLVGRVVPVIRTFISLPAGFADMPAGRFGLYTTLGCIPWTAALGIAGYALGANWQQVANAFHGPTYAIAGILVVAIVAALIMRRRRQKAADGHGDDGHGADVRGTDVRGTDDRGPDFRAMGGRGTDVRGAGAAPEGPAYPPGPGYPPGPARPPAGQHGGQGAGDWRPAGQQPPAPGAGGWVPPGAEPADRQWRPSGDRRGR